MSYTIHPKVRAALFDIDGTLTTGGDVWAALVHSQDVTRVKRTWLYTTAMPHYLLSKLGLVDQAAFRDRWVRLMAWLMGGWSEPQVQAIYDQIVEGFLLLTLRPDVVEILKTHKNLGHPVILVSSMFEGMASGFAPHVGADEGLGSQVEVKNGRCRGRIVGHTCSGARKLDFARRYLDTHHPSLTLADCAAYADSRSDIPFLEGVSYPVATYPDEAMREVAEARGWSVVEGDE
ncbi:MAG: HAD-IB family hydrolase [Chloroflexi bacterium]|nr:MAG: HAD-IB family hydrolase [Chloroflexota bacterium]